TSLDCSSPSSSSPRDRDPDSCRTLPYGTGAGGKIRVDGNLQLRKGMKAMNQMWKVGSAVSSGAPRQAHPRRRQGGRRGRTSAPACLSP
ncbi:unnamed protein product, partial [Urochloa humidicola]